MPAHPAAQETYTNAFDRFRAIWSARITPSGRKLVLLALTDFADKDGTNARPSIATLAARCNISPNQVRNHLHDLVNAGVIKITRPAAQHRADTYALDFVALSDLQHTVPLKGSRAPVHKFQGSSGRASGLQSIGDDPGNYPGKTRGSYRGAPRSGSALAGRPAGAVAELFAEWEKRSKWTGAEREQRIAEGERLSAGGYSLEAMLCWLLDVANNPKRKHYRDWPTPEPAFLKVQPTRHARVARGAVVADLGPPGVTEADFVAGL